MRGGDSYSTLDDAPDSALESAQKLREFALVHKDAVGFVLGGAVTRQSEAGYWGRAVELETGERVQMRFHPKGSAGTPLGCGETRLVAFRRIGPQLPVVVGFAVLFLPRAAEHLQVECGGSACTNSLGCRALQLLTPALMSKHDPLCERPVRKLNVTCSGYHVVLASVHSLTAAGSTLAVAPGAGYLVAAGQMAGVDVADPLQRAHVQQSHAEFDRSIAAPHSLLLRRLGKEVAFKQTCSAFSILEALSAEGLLAVRAHPFFRGAQPEAMQSPLGLGLLVAVASRIAVLHSHFKLRPPTTNDVHANHCLGMAFNSRWTPIGEREFRATDVVIHRSHVAALKAGSEPSASNPAVCARISPSPALVRGLACFLCSCVFHASGTHMAPLVLDNLVFLQRAGQRTNTRVVCGGMASSRCTRLDAMDTSLGRADLVDDCVSDAKREHFRRRKVGQPLAEPPMEELVAASHSDKCVQLYRVQDDVEAWLRYGSHDGVRISDPNPCPVSGGECDCISTRRCVESEETLNRAAMDSAINMTTALLVQGHSLSHQLGVDCYLVGPGCKGTCGDCGAVVDPLQAEILGSTAGRCSFCGAKKCFACSSAALHAARTAQRCGACSTGSAEQLPKPRSKKKKGRRPAADGAQ